MKKLFSLVAMLLLAVTAHAEIRRAEIKVFGMD